MIVAKIDVTKIDKAKLFAGKNGAKYLDICLIDRADDYGNSHMVVQSVSKEERAQGVRGAILGNAKTLGQEQPPSRQIPPRQSAPAQGPDEDLPF